MECATLDAALAEYASLCCTYRDVVRQWGRAIFSGQAAYDSDVEFALLREGARLYERLWRCGIVARNPQSHATRSKGVLSCRPLFGSCADCLRGGSFPHRNWPFGAAGNRRALCFNR